MKKSKLNILIERARNAVKNAGNMIADAHAECAVDNHPARSIIGHLRDLNDALYGLAIYCQHEVEQAEQAKKRVGHAEAAQTLSAPKQPEAKKCFVVPTAERMAQESKESIKQVRQRVSEWERLKKHNNKVLDAVVRDAALKKRIAQHLPVHKTCPSWGETQCGKALLTGNDPVSVLDWQRVTCPECLVGAPKKRAKGVQQRKDAAKLKLFVDTGDVPQRWVDPQPNHPSRFYLLVNGATKKRQAGNGYYTIEQARSLQKKLARPGVRVQVVETYLHK
jgi:hypothetical protein